LAFEILEKDIMTILNYFQKKYRLEMDYLDIIEEFKKEIPLKLTSYLE